MAKKAASLKVAPTASKILKDGRYGSTSKSVAGGAVAQRWKKGKQQVFCLEMCHAMLPHSLSTLLVAMLS